MSLIRLVGPNTVFPGAAFTLEVWLDAPSDLGAFELDLTFDPRLLEAGGATLGRLLASTGRDAGALGPLVDNRGGTLGFGGYSTGSEAGAAASGVLGRATFRALRPGAARIEVRGPLVVDTRGTLVATTAQGALVTVEGPKPVEPPKKHVYLPYARK